MDSVYSLSDIEKRIRPAGSRAGNLSILILGPNGAGKTTLGATAPSPLIIEIDPKGDDALTGLKVPVYDVEHWGDLEALYHYLYLEETRKKYQSLVLDTMTSAQALAVRSILTRNKYDMTRLTTSASNPMSPQLWGDVSRKMIEFIDKVVGLATYYHIILLAQEKPTEDQTTGFTILDAALQPATLTHIKSNVSMIGYLTPIPEIIMSADGEVEKYVFRNKIKLVSDATSVGKNRLAGKWAPTERKLPPVIINPNLTTIIKKVRGESAEKGTNNG